MMNVTELRPVGRARPTTEYESLHKFTTGIHKPVTSPDGAINPLGKFVANLAGKFMDKLHSPPEQAIPGISMTSEWQWNRQATGESQ